MAREYETFVDTLGSLKEGAEIELTIRDRKTYEARRVRAIVASSRQKLPDGNALYLRFSQGALHKQPWAIKITRELGGLFSD